MAIKKRVKSSSKATAKKKDPQKVARAYGLKVFKSIEGRSLNSVAESLRDAGKRIIDDADRWEEIKESDLAQIADTWLDLSLAQYELWLVGQKLRGVHGKAVRDLILPNYNELGLSQSAIASVSLASMGRVYSLRSPFFWKGKISAVLDILGEVTGIPFDLIHEFLGRDIDRLVQAMRELADARKEGTDSPRYKRAKRRLMRMLKKIFNKLTSRRFREFLIRKVGRELAEELLEKLAAMILPILGWLFFATLFIGLLYMWWEVILDP